MENRRVTLIKEFRMRLSLFIGIFILWIFNPAYSQQDQHQEQLQGQEKGYIHLSTRGQLRTVPKKDFLTPLAEGSKITEFLRSDDCLNNDTFNPYYLHMRPSELDDLLDILRDQKVELPSKKQAFKLVKIADQLQFTKIKGMALEYLDQFALQTPQESAKAATASNRDKNILKEETSPDRLYHAILYVSGKINVIKTSTGENVKELWIPLSFKKINAKPVLKFNNSNHTLNITLEYGFYFNDFEPKNVQTQYFPKY